MAEPRFDWTRDEIAAVYRQPFVDLVYEAQTCHRESFKPGEVQKSALLSIKTGACPEDCAYCPQSAHYQTEVERESLLPLDEVLLKARRAKSGGATRFCMGAAWRNAPDGEDFERVLAMVRGVAALEMEVCCTLGMLSTKQAQELAAAGLTAYNHNLDTSPEYYGEVITTRTYQDRLDTLAHVRDAGIQVCCGGIIGMGESEADRIGLLHQLATQNPHPESVPINMLVKVQGTPLGDTGEVILSEAKDPPTTTDTIEWIKTIATARIIMPQSFVRLSAGRLALSDEAQALAFMAGANSIFCGDKLLTTPNPQTDHDTTLFAKLGLQAMPPHKSSILGR